MKQNHNPTAILHAIAVGLHQLNGEDDNAEHIANLFALVGDIQGDDRNEDDPSLSEKFEKDLRELYNSIPARLRSSFVTDVHALGMIVHQVAHNLMDIDEGSKPSSDKAHLN